MKIHAKVRVSLSLDGEREGVRAVSRRSLPSSAPSTKAGLTFSPIGEKGATTLEVFSFL